MSEPSLFVYNDLEPNTTQIRLLTLQPGQITDPLITTLFIVSLDTKPHYEAISYVWGDETIRKDVQIDGTTMSITANLEAALRHVRLPTKQRIVWADAICINQRNIPEKNHQVSMMGRIYKQCAGCLAWLGEDDSGMGKRAFDFLLGSQEGHVRLPQCKPNLCDSGFRAVYHLLRKPWWTRVWTIQEFLLPKSVIFHCGRQILDLQVFENVLKNIAQHYNYDKCCIGRNGCDECVENMKQFCTACMALVIRPAAGTLARLAVLFTIYGERMASNKLDVVYAVLGLMDPKQVERLKIDYSMDPAVLYAAVTSEDIRLHQSFFLLSLADKHGRSTSILGLPSWVPDWSSPQEMYTLNWNRYNLYHACGSTLPDLRLVGDGKVLSILTAAVDVVKSVGRALPDFDWGRDRPDIAILTEWFELALSIQSVSYDSSQQTITTKTEPKEGTEPGSLKRRPTAFWLTVTGELMDAEGRERRTSHEGKEAFWTYWDGLTNEIPKDLGVHDTNEDLAIIGQVCSRNKFFITEMGYFGIGPKNMRDGDEIHVAEGGTFPLDLRRVEERPECLSGSLESSLMYEIVGGCFLHGFMDGEAMVNFEKNSRRVLIV